jgi:class 3 adenylate cyclase
VDVIGEPTNLAAWLQALVAPGVLISDATRRLVGGLFKLADLGAQRLKCCAQPIPAWRVRRRAERRLAANPHRSLTKHMMRIGCCPGP